MAWSIDQIEKVPLAVLALVDHRGSLRFYSYPPFSLHRQLVEILALVIATTNGPREL